MNGACATGEYVEVSAGQTANASAGLTSIY